MYLLYDTNLAQDWPWLLLIIAIMAGLVLYWRHNVAAQRELKAAEHDAYSHTVNDSNYNIAREGIDGHRDKGMDSREAERAVDTLKDTNQIPSREEFREIKKDMKK